MGCTVAVLVKQLLPGGTLAPAANALVLLQPSRTDFTWTPDGGTTWLPWQGDPSAVGYPGAIFARTNQSGEASFVVPYTDTEVHLPSAPGGAGPALQWQIIDPDERRSGQGIRVWYGILPSSVSSPQSLDALTQLGSDPWLVASTLYNGQPAGVRRRVSATFSEGESVNPVAFADIGFATWRFTAGIETDDDGVYVANVVKSTKTSAGCQVRLSQAVPTGKTVAVHLEIF